MDEIVLFSNIIVVGLSILLFIISMFSFYRVKNFKLLFISIAFLVFIIKGLLVLIEYISQDLLISIIDLVIILLLYFSVAKK